MRGRSTGHNPTHRTPEYNGKWCSCLAALCIQAKLENERGIVNAVGFKLVQQGVDSVRVFKG